MDKLATRIRAKRQGSVFTWRDLANLDADRPILSQALARLARQGEIRRLARGLYDKPRIDATLGPLSPSPDDIAAAIARRDGRLIAPTPARAANDLGLTTQVPAKPTYLTDGATRVLMIGGRDISFRRTAARMLVGGSTPVGQVFQALRHLGPDGCDRDALDQLRACIPSAQRRHLLDITDDVPDWMAPLLASFATGSTE
ncbi:MAG: DUF6088 family protein [Shimia sp.]